MSDIFKIYIDRLKNSNEEVFDDKVSPHFMNINETELKFPNPINLKGKAYIANTDLIVHLSTATTAKLPCKICNTMALYQIEIKNYIHNIPIENISNAIYDIREILREIILLEIPAYIECNKDNCEERKNIAKYLKQNNKKKEKELNNYFPFSELNN